MKKKKKTKISIEEEALLKFVKQWERGELYNYLDTVLQTAIYETRVGLWEEEHQMACSVLHELKNHILQIEQK